MGLLDKLGIGRLREGLAKTREGLIGSVTRILTGAPKVDEELLEHLEESLIAGDVGAGTAAQIMDGLRTRIKETPPEDAAGILPLLQQEIADQLRASDTAPSAAPYALPPERPYVILVVGINGVGKTTTIGKLARRYTSNGNKVLIAAADTFRAAAGEQLEIWAQRAGAEIVQQRQGADPAAVAFDAVKAAASRNSDVVIIDTAGRLHTRVNLMEELKKIGRVIKKQFPAAPHEVLLVIDASTGQNGLQQAKQFSNAVGVTGLVLTKLDGTAKGGIVLAITREMNIPVRYIGVGEKVDDLQPFSPADFAEALFQA
ncbi:MAG: signal recognition particle-docking protein FtsY [Bacteroidetes bacterium]|nr:signal recognition particle-docking protein FtsY [Bacteroidota bacterium]